MILLLKVSQLKKLAAELNDMADAIEGMANAMDCCCEGSETCVCGSVYRTANDLATVAKMCQEEAARILAINPRRPATAA